MSVRADGRISIQFINEIEAAGKTALKLASDIENGLKSQIRQPLVTVTVEVSSPLSISVLGEVTKPGVTTLPPNAGVADALAAAGGLTQFAHKNRIYVVRPRPQPTRIHFTYDSADQERRQGIAVSTAARRRPDRRVTQIARARTRA